MIRKRVKIERDAVVLNSQRVGNLRSWNRIAAFPELGSLRYYYRPALIVESWLEILLGSENGVSPNRSTEYDD